jgi:hypothetical protein
VTFDVQDPEALAGCHCTRCQRWTGGASSMVLVVHPKNFKVTQGADLVRRFHEDGFSDRGFCTNCGSGLYAAGNDKLYVSAGAVKNVPMKPTFHIQVAYKAPWDEIGGSAPQFAEWPTH